MSLEQSILKEFAKITNDSSQNNQNGYLRGTAKLEGNKKFVRIDGSTSLTPISEIVDVQDGDRVLVTIENHKATVIGNITKPPSARKEEEALDKANGAQDSANTAMEKAKAAGEKAEDALTDSSIASALANEAKQSAKEATDAAGKATVAAGEAKEFANAANNSSIEAKEQAAQAQADVANANSEINRINGEVTNAKGDISDALSKLGEQATEIGMIKETYSTKIETDTVKADLTTEIGKKVGELQTTITENYYTKTDVVEIEGKLQSQITQNAEGLTSTASKVEKLQSDTEKAQEDVNKALDAAQKAQDSADTAIKNAADAKAEAEESEANAKIASEKAQASRDLADKAEDVIIKADKSLAESKTSLNEAEKNLEFVLKNPSATEDEIATARAKVEAAQIAVNAALEDVAEAKYAADKATEAAELAEQEALTAMKIASAANSRAYTAKLAADKAIRDAKKAQADVASLTLRVTSAETKIDQNADAITLSAKKVEEIGDSLKNDYYSKTQTDAAISVSADKINQSVSEKVEIEIGNIEIGGRNLILNSNFKDGDISKWIQIGEPTILKTIEMDEKYWVHLKSNGLNSPQGYSQSTIDTNVGLRDIIVDPNNDYTYSFRAKGNIENQDIYVCIKWYSSKKTETNEQVLISEVWDTFSDISIDDRIYSSVIKSPDDTSISHFAILVGSNNSSKIDDVFFTDINFEKGNKISDWALAPEDIEIDYNSKIDSVNKNITEIVHDYTTNITQTKDSIIHEVSEKYYGKEETDRKVSEVSTSLTQTKDSFELIFNQFQKNLDELSDGQNTNLDDLRKYIRFIDGKIILGIEGNEFTLRISNDRISFMQSSNEIAYISNSKMYITDSEVVNSQQIGNFAFLPRANGSLDFKKVGG